MSVSEDMDQAVGCIPFRVPYPGMIRQLGLLHRAVDVSTAAAWAGRFLYQQHGWARAGDLSLSSGDRALALHFIGKGTREMVLVGCCGWDEIVGLASEPLERAQIFSGWSLLKHEKHESRRRRRRRSIVIGFKKVNADCSIPAFNHVCSRRKFI